MPATTTRAFLDGPLETPFIYAGNISKGPTPLPKLLGGYGSFFCAQLFAHKHLRRFLVGFVYLFAVGGSVFCCLPLACVFPPHVGGGC